MLEKKIIVVTAGCAGLGKEFTRHLLSQGAIVIPTSRSEEKTISLLSDLSKDQQERCFPEILTFDSEESISEFVALLKAKYGQIYGLVNCAVCRKSITDPGSTKLREWQEHYTINLFLTVNLMEQVSRKLISDGGGAIVNISSFYSQVVPDNRIYDSETIPTSLIYASSKAALNYATQYMAVEFAALNVRVNAILAGGVYNPTIQANSFLDGYIYRTPANRMANPCEFNAALSFLLSPDNEFCTGQLITVDGGWSLL